MIYQAKKIWETVRYGNILEALLYRLSDTGVSIKPYYFIRQGHNFNASSECRTQQTGYTFCFLGSQDMKTIEENASWTSTKEEWQTLLKEGKKCFAAKYQNQIVASIWISLDEYKAKWGNVRMKKNEAYLFALCVREDFRGLRIAEYLSCQCYRILREMGRDTLYSYCSLFNRSAVKSLRRLEADFLQTELHIELLKRYRWAITLKEF